MSHEEREMKTRNRQGETIPIEYLINCDKYHDIWIHNNNNLPIVLFNGEINIDNKETYKHNIFQKIIPFISKHLKKININITSVSEFYGC